MHNFGITTSQHQPISYMHTISTSPVKIHTNGAFSQPIHKIHPSPSQTLTWILLLNKPYSSPIFHSHYPIPNTNVCIDYNYILTKELNLPSLAILLQLCANFAFSRIHSVFFHSILFSDFKPSLYVSLMVVNVQLLHKK